MCKSCIFGVVLTIAIIFVSACAAETDERWYVAWFDTVANKSAKYEAIDRADAELFIHTNLQGINLATRGPACTMIRLFQTKDGAAQQVDTFTFDWRAAVDCINKPVAPGQAAAKVKALEKEGWLKALARSERKRGDILQEFGQRLKNEGKEVSDFRKVLKEDAAEVGEKELDRINDFIANYNRIAIEVMAGPLSASIRDLSTMKPLSGAAEKISARLAWERLLTVQTKLEEIGLRLEQRDLAETRDQLRAEIERIGRAKEAGLDVQRREQDLDGEINIWKARRDLLQRRIENHSRTVDDVFTARETMQDLLGKSSQTPPSESK